mmetsp:Transcript_15165/g.39015  ORF Transcript_15165/g.39015 Transcript_15165/m.39015 type:complete len:1020 (+) Transcript_15165:84-3143(+)
MPSGAVLAPGNAKEEALWTAFQKFDVNGDGKIQADEFTRLMKSLGSFSSMEIKRLFTEADLDNSGGIDWREFIKWICSGNATKGMDAVAAASFKRMLAHEHEDEASFVEQADASKRLKHYLKESNAERCEAEDAALQRRKLTKAKKAMNAPAGSAAAGAAAAVAAAPPGNDLGIGDNYHGFRLPLPVTLEGASALMKHYLMTGDGEPIHPKYVSYLTTTFTSAYRARHPKPVVMAETPKPGRFIVVGDTHGQLADVLHILHQHGPPSATNKYLFNGDMCDRGPNSVEILLILFAFFIADPECIIIHRGNHENEDMNALDADGGGGFADEVMKKYGLMAYRRFVSAMKSMSLCSVVENEIFVVHGGLSRVSSLSIDYINSMKHHECTTPHPTATEIKDQVFSDLVWSDPTDHPGKFKSERGIGIKFGPDITTKFCMRNRLRFIIRSHQVPGDGRGYMKQHEGRCVTIFSASNYCGDGQNYGAVLVLDSQHFPRYEIIEHYAAALEELPLLIGHDSGTKLTNEEARDKQEAASNQRRWEKELGRMIVGIVERKPALWAHIVDLSLGNFLTTDTWKEVVSELVEPNLPWLEAAAHWGIMSRNGKVEMDKFLGRWVVNLDSERYTSFLGNAVKTVYEAVLRMDMDLEQTLKLFDKDGDGTVDLKEVREVLGMFELGLTASQLDRLTGQIFTQVLSMDCGDKTSEDNTRINVQDFLGNFMVIYKANLSLTGSSDDNEPKLEKWVQQALNAIGTHITTLPADQLITDMDKAALKIQKAFRGNAVRKEVTELKNHTSPKKGVGGSKSGGLPKTPKKDDPPRSFSKGSTLAAIGDNTRSKMVALFAALDESGDGILQVDEFVDGIEKVPGITSLVVDGQPLCRDRLKAMAMAIDGGGNSNGTINYMEFLQAFETAGEGSQLFADSLGEDITTVLFRHRLAIRMGCQYLDEEGTGTVHAEDFDRVLHGVNSVLSGMERMLTNTQIKLLVEALKQTEGEDGEDVVDYDAFLRSFVILDTALDRAVVKRF